MGGLPALVVWMAALTDAGLANLRLPDRRGFRRRACHQDGREAEKNYLTSKKKKKKKRRREEEEEEEEEEDKTPLHDP